MRNYFEISEFIIDPDATDLPIHVANKILQYHLPILNEIRHETAKPLIISKHSGYRSIQWEKEHGRSGNSEHTFKGKGAVDLRSSDLDELVYLLKESDYSRVCYYPHHGFVHCDFKEVDKKQYFEADANGNWQFKSFRAWNH